MNQFLPRPQFWAETQKQIKTRFSMFGELMILLLLMLLSMLGQAVFLLIPSIFWVFSEQGEAALSAMSSGESMEALMSDLLRTIPDWLFLCAFLGYAVMGAVAIIYCRKYQKRSLSSMGLCGRAPLGEYALGLCFGLLLAGAILALGVAAGGFRLAEEAVSGEKLGLLLLALAGCLVQGAALELLLRGYFAPSLGAHYPIPAALVFSTLVSVMFRSPGSLTSLSFANTLLLELLLGIWVLKRGKLWSACALHGAWVFSMSFLFGFAPAGEHEGVYLIAVETDAWRGLLTGGDAGPQASICATVVLLAALAAVLALPARDPASAFRPEDEQAANKL